MRFHLEANSRCAVILPQTPSRNTLDSVVAGVPSGDHLFMDANARTGKRKNGCADSKVLGAYGRHELNELAEGLLLHAADNKLAIINSPRPPLEYRTHSNP